MKPLVYQLNKAIGAFMKNKARVRIHERNFGLYLKEVMEEIVKTKFGGYRVYIEQEGTHFMIKQKVSFLEKDPVICEYKGADVEEAMYQVALEFIRLYDKQNKTLGL
jgi:hypothetical protein